MTPDKLSQAIAAAPVHEVAVREVQVYPSSGKLVIGLRLAKPDHTDTTAGTWVYLSAAPHANAQSQSVGLPDLQTTSPVEDPQLASTVQQMLTQLRDATANLDYGISYQNLLIAANERLTRPLKDGFRMEGHLASAGVDKVLLLADGITVAVRASGELKILYGV